MSERISKFELSFLITTVMAALIVSPYAQPLIHNNDEAISLLATVFSILAGLLIGIVTLLSDVSIIPGTGWRAAVLAKPVLTRRLHRHRLLFLVYLATLSLLLASILVPDCFYALIKYLEVAYVFLGIIGFVYSFRLPWTLARIQAERLDSLIRERRRTAGLDEERED